MSSFEGKVAIVTGGASGIGRAAVELFLERGAKVAIVDRTADTGRALATQLGNERDVIFLSCDVSQYTDVQHTVKLALDHFGQIDILVNNAGRMCPIANAETLAIEDWHTIIATNLNSVFYFAKEVLGHMVRRQSGVVINTASVSGMGGDAGFGPYNASKGAVINYTRTLAIDYGMHGIRVNAVCPGATLTPPAISGLISPESQREWFARIPLRRYAEPVDIARVIAFLASDEAAYVSGAILPVDGGLTARSGNKQLTLGAAGIGTKL
jgi:meso-butanediol dehydrogenase/(S,S)-butanediol dehydrogenase/diacetyl reductase